MVSDKATYGLAKARLMLKGTINRFLLKYVSRDEVDLFERGNGGIVEIRNAIAQYEEVSPLFGFLRYRRRNVHIKYVPEGCSRLVQGSFKRCKVWQAWWKLADEEISTRRSPFQRFLREIHPA